MFDSPFTDFPPDGEDDRLKRPFATGFINGLRCNCIFAVFAVVIILSKSYGIAPVNWWVIGSIPVGIFVVAFAHAFFASRFGRRRAWFVFAWLICASLCGLLIWLAWYLDAIDKR